MKIVECWNINQWSNVTFIPNILCLIAKSNLMNKTRTLGDALDENITLHYVFNPFSIFLSHCSFLRAKMMIVRVSSMLISSMRTRTLRGPENQSSFKKTLEEYLATSSIHGLAQIGRYAVQYAEEKRTIGILYLTIRSNVPTQP